MSGEQHAKTHAHTNRLDLESSPYLRQHAHNPVDWYPWGDEALSRAKVEARPIFLSIGYSACHWCHVMEHESFENEAIARLMNEWFVNIKVDREERPDLDHIYMSAVQAMTGSGGWPMSVFLTPELKPFFGGTYWPPGAKYGRPGFPDVLRAVHEAWTVRRDAIETQARELTEAVIESTSPATNTVPLGEDILRNALRSLLRAADTEWGGFGGAPKFPHAMDLRLLLRLARRFQSPEALRVVQISLDRMALGGIYDHLGGGFARYSTDERWLVPHFEKMLYDNALLVHVYLDAWRQTGEPLYRRVVCETLDYVLREMTSEAGGFYSAQDADSEGVEGKFFVWSLEEVQAVLPADDAAVFCRCYDVTAHGNWEHSNILHWPQSLAECATALNMTPEAIEESLGRSRAVLFAVRSRRVFPGLDDKVLASWNGLMIAAMTRAGTMLQVDRYRHAAVRSAQFVVDAMLTPEGRLCHTWHSGMAKLNGYLDDYAAMLDALTEVYQSTGDATWLVHARQLAHRLQTHFADPQAGGYFFTSHDHEQLLTRYRDLSDNATPSGGSLAAGGLFKLGALTGELSDTEAAEATLNAFSGVLARSPMAAGQSLLALDDLLGPMFQLVLCEGEEARANQQAVLALETMSPMRAVRVRVPASGDVPQVLAPLAAGKRAIDGEPTLYICHGPTCQPPVVGASAIVDAVKRLS